jgi:hypothetical protein
MFCVLRIPKIKFISRLKNQLSVKLTEKMSVNNNLVVNLLIKSIKYKDKVQRAKYKTGNKYI